MRTVITVASCALIVVAAPCLAAPQAQPAGGGIDPTPLGAPSIREARRVGIVMLGAGGESARAAATVQAWLESAGKHVVRLRSMPAIPLRPIVANMNQTFHLEVTAFVRILTPGDHSAVAVEFRDAQGEPVQGPGERARELPAIQFALPATPPPSEQDDDDDDGEEPKAIAPPAMLLHTDRGRPYLGAARLQGDELYLLTARPDLAARYRRRHGVKIAAGAVGVAGLAAGVTLFVVGAILDIGAGWAAEGQEPAPSTLRKLLPAVWICTGAGGALLAGAILYPADPVDATERQRLMHDYNASGVSDAEPVDHPSPRRQPVAVSFAPLAARASDALVLGGQLRLSF